MKQKNGPASPVTLRDIAKAVGVSHVTVSAALRNSPRISEKRRLQIHEMAEQMGYRPNAIAAALARFKSASSATPVQAALGWLNLWSSPEKLRGYREFEYYWRGALAAAEKFGFHLEEFACGKRTPLSRVEEILVARGINGLLLPPHGARAGRSPEWGRFDWSQFAIVRFGRTLETPRAHVVAADEFANTVLATDEIAARGYQRIGFVTGFPYHDRLRHFDAGFLFAQQDMDEKPAVPVCNLDEANPAWSRKRLAPWLKREKPDAILSDYAFLAPLLKEIGVRVPEDVGLAVTSILDGGGDAGIDQNAIEIGRVGMLMLVSLLHDNAYGIPPIFRETLIKGEWVDGVLSAAHFHRRCLNA